MRGLASSQRRWARQWSGVTIATPYRPRPVEITNGLIGRLQRCKWLLTDPATFRDLLWRSPLASACIHGGGPGSSGPPALLVRYFCGELAFLAGTVMSGAVTWNTSSANFR